MGSYVPSNQAERQAMLQSLGVSSVKELYDAIPPEVLLNRELNIPEGKAEMAVRDQMEALAAKNVVFPSVFRGAGAYRHYIPSIAKYIPAKEEFLTAYTPYQAEISQGVLQSIFEFQTDDVRADRHGRGQRLGLRRRHRRGRSGRHVPGAQAPQRR